MFFQAIFILLGKVLVLGDSMLEKSWPTVPPTLFTANGNALGLVSCVSTAGFKVKAEVVISANTLPNLLLEVKRVISPTQLFVGPIGKPITTRTDISAYTTALTSFIYQAEQARNTIPPIDIIQAVYDQEPGVRLRVGLIDEFGNNVNNDNPLPIAFDGTIAIGDVEVKGPSGNYIDPNADGSLKPVALFTKPYDAITATYPTTVQEIYSSRVGGISGVIQQTVVVNYTDTTKNFIVNATRTFG